MIPAFGWIGSALCAYCGIPETVRSIRNGNCGAGWGLLLTWGIGEVFLLIYILFNWDTPLFINYLVNVICVSTMVGYKLKAKRTEK